VEFCVFTVVASAVIDGVADLPGWVRCSASRRVVLRAHLGGIRCELTRCTWILWPRRHLLEYVRTAVIETVWRRGGVLIRHA
jgi:hypothetical protein